MKIELTSFIFFYFLEIKNMKIELTSCVFFKKKFKIKNIKIDRVLFSGYKPYIPKSQFFSTF